jgi:hypothetical protein
LGANHEPGRKGERQVLVLAAGAAYAGVVLILQVVLDPKMTNSDIRMQPFYFLNATDEALN